MMFGPVFQATMFRCGQRGNGLGQPSIEVRIAGEEIYVRRFCIARAGDPAAGAQSGGIFRLPAKFTPEKSGEERVMQAVLWPRFAGEQRAFFRVEQRRFRHVEGDIRQLCQPRRAQGFGREQHQAFLQKIHFQTCVMKRVGAFIPRRFQQVRVEKTSGRCG